MTTKQHKVWSQKHYNAIAHDIRELFPIDPVDAFLSQDEFKRERDKNMIKRGTLTALALSLAVRFKQDSDEAEQGLPFNPIKFMDACSPDTDLYPLSELWENYE